MKTASKVFIIIGIIVGFIWIIPPIVGFIALSKINSAKCKNDLVVTGIFTMLFCSLLGGIFMFCIPEEDFKVKNAQNTQQNDTTSQPQKKDVNLQANLEKLNKLKEQGIIDENEYKALRQREIDKAFND